MQTASASENMRDVLLSCATAQSVTEICMHGRRVARSAAPYRLIVLLIVPCTAKCTATIAKTSRPPHALSSSCDLSRCVCSGDISSASLHMAATAISGSSRPSCYPAAVSTSFNSQSALRKALPCKAYPADSPAKGTYLGHAPPGLARHSHSALPMHKHTV